MHVYREEVAALALHWDARGCPRSRAALLFFGLKQAPIPCCIPRWAPCFFPDTASRESGKPTYLHPPEGTSNNPSALPCRENQDAWETAVPQCGLALRTQARLGFYCPIISKYLVKEWI